METIDNLPLENSPISDSNSSLSSINFRILLTTIMADRMAYYGLRSILVVYSIEQFQVSEVLAYTHYGYLTTTVYVCMLIGGFLGDLILGARNGLLLGFGLCTGGAIAAMIPDSTIFYVGLLFIALGSGFIRPNTFSLIGHGTADDIVLLEKRFISMYGALNVGAFLAAIVISYIGSSFGFVYAFVMVIVLYALSFGLTFIIRPKSNSTILNNREANKPPRPVVKSLLIVILTIFTAGTFWMIFELYTGQIISYKFDAIRRVSAYSSLMYSATSVILLLLVIPYYFVAKRLSIYLKMGIGISIISLCWLIACLVDWKLISIGLTSVVILLFIETIAELFVSPISLVILSKHVTKRYYGIVMGTNGIFIALAMRLLYRDELPIWEYVVQTGLVIVAIAAVILYSILSFTQKAKVKRTDADL